MGKTLVIMRHSKALDLYESGAKDDFSRPLSQEGLIKAYYQAQALKKELGTVDLIAASPLKRAQETAKIAAEVFGIKEVKTLPELADCMAVDAYEKAAQNLTAKHEKVIIVGHNPAVSALAQKLGGEYAAMSAGDYKIIKS